MVGNNCVGCYWPKSSSPYEQGAMSKPREKIYDSEDDVFNLSSPPDILGRHGSLADSELSQGCWKDFRSLPRRNRRKGSPVGSRTGMLAWLNLMADLNPVSKTKVEFEALSRDDNTDEEINSYLQHHQQHQQQHRHQPQHRQNSESLNSDNLQEIHASYQGKRFDFVDEILEAPLFTRRRELSQPFIQSVDNKQVLLGKVEPLHLSQALRRRDHVFHCYEFLLLTKLESDTPLWKNLCDRFGYCDECRGLRGGCSDPHSAISTDMFRVSAIKPDLWFLAVALKDSKDKLIHFIRSEMPRRNFISSAESSLLDINPSFLLSYLSAFNFVELRLDNVLEPGSQLPSDIFRCINVRTLSLKNNFIKRISPEIGKMIHLERLFLTHNQLDVKAIPFTLPFCSMLREVYLDNNLLDALPCILLRVANLRRVHRHGNHNYFKDTFMFYHTDINDRILQLSGLQPIKTLTKSQSLQSLSGAAVLSSRQNFFNNPAIPPSLKSYLSLLADNKELCDACSMVLPLLAPKYRVFTFKNPYLGNTCVPFQHTACSSECAERIEVPARKEQISSARQQDWEYQQYIRESTLYLEDLVGSPVSQGVLSDSLRSRSSRRSSVGSRSEFRSPTPGSRSRPGSSGRTPGSRASVASGHSASKSGSLASLRQNNSNCGII